MMINVIVMAMRASIRVKPARRQTLFVESLFKFCIMEEFQTERRKTMRPSKCCKAKAKAVALDG